MSGRGASPATARTLKTAQAIHAGDIIIATPRLREPALGPLWDGSTMRLLHGGWMVLMHLVWMTNHRSQTAIKADFDA